MAPMNNAWWHEFMKHAGGRDVVETARRSLAATGTSRCQRLFVPETIGEPFEILTSDFQQSAALVKQRNPISGPGSFACPSRNLVTLQTRK